MEAKKFPIKNVGIAGFGTMGREIALVCALSGFLVKVFEVYEPAISEGRQRLEKLLKLLKRDSSEEERVELLGRIEVTKVFSSITSCDLVIEAILERYDVKEEFYNRLGKELKEGAIAATNTSSLSLTRLARAFGRQDAFVGLHFFNPPTQMKLVEVAKGLLTSEQTVNTCVEFVKKLDKAPILVKETPGFVVNRVLVAMAVEAMRVVEEGIAEIKDVDDAMRLGAGWPMGPFKLMDLVGLDVFLHACETIHSELGESKFRPPQLLRRYVQAGLLGKKTGRGFYSY